MLNGKIVKTPFCETPDGDADVIIAGLGTAGAIACILCAQKGLRVLGLEPLSCLGGTGTAGGITGYYHGNPGGYYQEIDRAAGGGRMGTDAFQKSTIMHQRALDAGAKILFGASVTGVLMEKTRVIGVEWVDASGRHFTTAKTIIDATGDGYLALAAGCAVTHGRQSDNGFQPYSYVFATANGGRVVHHNIDSGTINPYDPWAYSAEILKTSADEKHLWENYPQDAILMGFCPILGVREGCTIIGEERVTLEGVTLQDEASLPLFYGYSNVDHHGKDTAYEDEAARDWLSIAGLWGVGIRFGVPCGALIPRGFDGLLVAGRAMSVDHSFAPALRMKDEMQKSGEAAAAIADYSIRNNLPLHALPRDQAALASIRDQLSQSGCLNMQDVPGLFDERLKVNLRWLTNAYEIRAGLSSDEPGLAIWSARRMYKEISEELCSWLNSNDKMLQRNTALSLALCGNNAGEDVLLEMISDRSGYIPKMSRKYNPPHAISAITAVGRLRLRSAVPQLKEIIENPDYTANIPFEADELLDSRETQHFLWFSASQTALQSIAEAHPDLRNDITALLSRQLNDPCFKLRVGLKASNLIVDAIPTAKRVFERWSNSIENI